MKKIEVKRLNIQQVKAEEIPSLFKTFDVEYHNIDTVDWPEEYPYCPNVEFAIAHQNDAILLHYRVEENSPRATVANDLGNVWEDSCCEFFFSLNTDTDYYNLESNCISTVLLCNGKGRNNRTQAPTNILNQINRWASLGREPFEQCEGQQTWQLALIIPVSAFFHHHIETLSGQILRANFYKCGDKTPQPHFLSWNEINIPSPDFHRPDFFGQLTFL